MSSIQRAGIVAYCLFMLCLAPAAWAQDSKAVDDLKNQALVALSKGKPEEAVSILRRAIDVAPTRSDLYMLRSRARDSSGKFDAAVEDATKYIELEPNESFGYLNRARIYLSQDKSDKALEDTNKAIEMAPNDSDGYYRRADIYTQMGKDAEAKADEAKAEALDKAAR